MIENEGGFPSAASDEFMEEQMGGAGRRAVSPPAEDDDTVISLSSRSQARPKIPVHSDLKRMLGDIRAQDYLSHEPDADEYDIPTFLRKHAD